MRTLTISLIVVAAACACSSPVSQPTPLPVVLAPLVCDMNYWNPTYRKDRLVVHSMCVHAIAYITRFEESERDGDKEYHVIPQTDELLFPGNVHVDNGNGNPKDCGPKGCLMIEIPCQEPDSITQDDAIGTCAKFLGTVFTAAQLPRFDQCYEFAGPSVEDLNHFRWGEIHGAVFRPVACPADLLEKVSAIQHPNP